MNSHTSTEFNSVSWKFRHVSFKSRKIIATFGILILGFLLILTYPEGLFFNLKTRRLYKSDHISMNNRNLTLDDIFISVKTSKCFETTRLPIILKTWFQMAKQQTWFFTDTTNLKLFNQINGHMINTNCTRLHNRRGLNCKMGVEFDYYIESGKKWFCHFDDDNYVNVPCLLKVLRTFDYKHDWYLGKRSKRYKLVVDGYFRNYTWQYFSFATGGAGFCLSQSLALKLYPVVAHGKLKKICFALLLADDVCLGFVINYVTRKSLVKLTQLSKFHSHLEPLKNISIEDVQDQISFSYHSMNVLNIPGFNVTYDPTRFLSLHCYLFPSFKHCSDIS